MRISDWSSDVCSSDLLTGLAGISATPAGFVLTPRQAREVVVLARPVEEPHAAVLAFLADSESCSSSALALALGTSQRSVQRAPAALSADGKVQAPGRGRAGRPEGRRAGKKRGGTGKTR